MTKIEKFAQDKMDITLNEVHLKYMKAWLNGMLISPSRIGGVSTAKKVLIAYMEDGMKEVEDWFKSKDSSELADPITKFHEEALEQCRKDTAADILSLANEYADKDKTMIGSESIRGYHYFNALNKIGEFPGR